MIGGLILLFIVFVLAPAYIAARIVFGMLKKKNAKRPLLTAILVFIASVICIIGGLNLMFAGTRPFGC